MLHKKFMGTQIRPLSFIAWMEPILNSSAVAVHFLAHAKVLWQADRFCEH